MENIHYRQAYKRRLYDEHIWFRIPEHDSDVSPSLEDTLCAPENSILEQIAGKKILAFDHSGPVRNNY